MIELVLDLRVINVLAKFDKSGLNAEIPSAA